MRAKRSAEDVQALLMPETTPAQPSADVRSALFSGLSPEAAAELLTMCVLDVGAPSFSYLLSTTERYKPAREQHENRDWAGKKWLLNAVHGPS